MIVTFATQKYKQWLELALIAYRKSNPSGVAKVYLVNFDNNPYQNDAITEYTMMKLDFTNPEVLMRFKLTVVLYELILNQKNLFWIDADIIIMKDLTSLLDKLNHCDLLCLNRPQETTPYHRKVAAGAFGVSPKAIPALAKWSKLSWAHDTNWWADQVCLHEMSKEVDSISLTSEEFSLKGNPNATMFTMGFKDYQLCKDLITGGVK